MNLHTVIDSDSFRDREDALMRDNRIQRMAADLRFNKQPKTQIVDAADGTPTEAFTMSALQRFRESEPDDTAYTGPMHIGAPSAAVLRLAYHTQTVTYTVRPDPQVPGYEPEYRFTVLNRFELARWIQQFVAQVTTVDMQDVQIELFGTGETAICAGRALAHTRELLAFTFGQETPQ